MIYLIMVMIISFGVYLYTRRSKTRVPSGMKVVPIERGLPIIGILHNIEGPLCNYLIQLAKKHGPIYQIKFGMRDVVVLNNFEYIRAALVNNGEAFTGRYQLFHHIFSTKGFGIIQTEGSLWVEQRAFILKNLKDFGIGRSGSVEIVQDECVWLLNELEKMNSKTIDFSTFISLYTANSISKFIMNRRFTHEDREMKTIEGTMKVIASKKDIFAYFVLMFPFLDNNVWLIKFLFWITSRKLVFNETFEVFAKEIRTRLQTLDFSSDGHDLVDRFLIRQHQLKEKDEPVGWFIELQLVITSFDLFIAGYDTTSATLTWIFMFMAMYPDVQKKVFEEISDKIGTERLPTMSDKASLVYTQAVMDEIIRLGAVAPLALFHRTLKNTCINGYFIPKDTLIIPNLLACHVDPSIWEKPFEFYPAHFLFTDEKQNVKYRPREELITFSMGKRQCLGESLARTELFIFFIGILQRFFVHLPDGIGGKTVLEIFQAGDGVIRKPYYKDFIFKKRN